VSRKALAPTQRVEEMVREPNMPCKESQGIPEKSITFVSLWRVIASIVLWRGSLKPASLLGFYGESAGARTQDQRLKRAMLYQLSYALRPHYQITTFNCGHFLYKHSYCKLLPTNVFLGAGLELPNAIQSCHSLSLPSTHAKKGCPLILSIVAQNFGRIPKFHFWAPKGWSRYPGFM
jgi:hypothetical protein